MKSEEIHDEAYRQQEQFALMETGQRSALHQVLAKAVVFTRALSRIPKGVPTFFSLPFFKKRKYAPNPAKLIMHVLCFVANAHKGPKYKRACSQGTALHDLVADEFVNDEEVAEEIDRLGGIDAMEDDARARKRHKKDDLSSLEIEGDPKLIVKCLEPSVGNFLTLRVRRTRDGVGGWRRLRLITAEPDIVEDY